MEEEEEEEEDDKMIDVEDVKEDIIQNQVNHKRINNLNKIQCVSRN